LLPPFTGDLSGIKHQLELARSVYEHAAKFSVKQKDYKSFERHIVQLKTYYYDYAPMLSESERKWQMLGLNLLGLLAHNHLALFHTELEMISFEEREESNPYIYFVVQMEQRLMEGNYNKVLRMRKTLPLPEYQFFTDMLSKTVREKISDCCEKGYQAIPLEDARQMLMFESKEEVMDHVEKRGWKISEGTIKFAQKADDAALNIPAKGLIVQTLNYATEMERIV